MKVVIGHDGSSYADAAIADLQRAGLPEKVEALVVTVGDAPLVAPFASHRIIEQTFVGERVRSIVEHANKQAEDALSEAGDIAQSAALQLSLQFPSWKVSGEVVSGEPAAQLIRTASQLHADLVVVGTHGRSALGRLILGSVSHEVLRNAPCSVRVGRAGAAKGMRSGLRILVGLDRRGNADKMLRRILQRSWPRDTELRVVTVDEGDATTTFGTFQELFAGEVKVSAGFLQGDMRELLIAEASRWQADCIVLGPETIDARPEGLVESTLWTDLLSGAECSLEIVR